MLISDSKKTSVNCLSPKWSFFRFVVHCELSCVSYILMMEEENWVSHVNHMKCIVLKMDFFFHEKNLMVYIKG